MNKLIIIILIVLFTASSQAADIFWGDTSGGAANLAACESDSDPGSGNRCTLNQGLGMTGGQTMNLIAGTYTTSIIPTNSGSSGSYITFQIAAGEDDWSVVISTASYGANLSGKSYIKLKGLYFNDCGSRWILSTNGDYNWIDTCRFYDSISGGGIRLDTGSSYNKLTNLLINQDAPAVSAPGTQTDPEDFIELRSGSNYNLIEDCTFTGHVSHAPIDITQASYNVVRDNIFSNEWHTGLIVNAQYTEPGTTLVEGNTFYNNGINYDSNTNTTTANGDPQYNPGLQLIGKYSIVRLNNFYNNNAAIYFGAYSSAADITADYSSIYHNSIYDSNYDSFQLLMNSSNECTGVNIVNNASFGAGVRQWYYNTEYGTPNNFSFNNAWESGEDTFTHEDTTLRSLSYLETNYGQGSGAGVEWWDNIEIASSGWNSPATGDFTLTSGAGQIDSGAWLTTITQNSGSGTTFAVNDEKYFYDGWDIPGEVGDTIYTSRGQTAVVTDVDPQAGTLTVTPSISWSIGDGITVVNYVGTKPDIGAYEYTEADPEPPDSITVGGVVGEYDPDHGRDGTYSEHGSDIR